MPMLLHAAPITLMIRRFITMPATRFIDIAADDADYATNMLPLSDTPPDAATLLRLYSSRRCCCTMMAVITPSYELTPLFVIAAAFAADMPLCRAPCCLDTPPLRLHATLRCCRPPSCLILHYSFH